MALEVPLKLSVGYIAGVVPKFLGDKVKKRAEYGKFAARDGLRTYLSPE